MIPEGFREDKFYGCHFWWVTEGGSIVTKFRSIVAAAVTRHTDFASPAAAPDVAAAHGAENALRKGARGSKSGTIVLPLHAWEFVGSNPGLLIELITVRQ